MAPTKGSAPVGRGADAAGHEHRHDSRDRAGTLSRRRGRGKAAKSIKLVAAAQRILEEIQPATVRAVCYRLFVAGLIPSMDRKHVNAVGTQLVWAREQGIIPWDHIVDETREIERVATWNDPEEIIRTAVKSYRKDYWNAQPIRLEVWSEKGTVRGTVAPVLEEFALPFRVMHGFGSATAIHDIADLTAEIDRPLVALYVGDFDPSGLYMSDEDLPRRLAKYGGRVEIVRIALDRDDVGPGSDLPSFALETKANDPRWRWFRQRYGLRCWELDAMSPNDLRQRVREHVEVRLDTDAWQHARRVEAVEEESLGQVLIAWKGICDLGRKYS